MKRLPPGTHRRSKNLKTFMQDPNTKFSQNPLKFTDRGAHDITKLTRAATFLHNTTAINTVSFANLVPTPIPAPAYDQKQHRPLRGVAAASTVANAWRSSK
jgi:hypothetical protein